MTSPSPAADSGAPSKRGRGRPRLDAEAKRGQRLQLHLTSAEEDLVTSAAALGNEKAAEYGRRVLVAQARRDLRP